MRAWGRSGRPVPSPVVPQAVRRGRVSALGLVLGFAAVSGLVLGGMLYQVRTETLRAGAEQTEALAQVIAEQTARSYQAADQRLQLAINRLEALEAAGPPAEAEARDLLRQQLAELPFVRALWVLDREGRIAYDSDTGNVGVSLADRAYFKAYQRAPQTEFFVGPAVRSRSTGTWLMSASRPLRGPGGEVRGVITAALLPAYFQQLWRGIDLGRGGVIALFHQSGQMMLRVPHEEIAVGHDLSALPLFTQYLPRADHGVFRSVSVIDKHERIAAYRRLASHPELVVLVGSSVPGLLAGWRRMALVAGGVWLLAAASAGWLAWQLQRQGARRAASDERFFQLAQAMPQIVFAADSSGVVYFMNERWADATGRPVSEALGTGWQDFIHPEDRARSLAALAEMAASGQEMQNEHRLLHRTGEYRWQLLRAVPVRGADGRPHTWYGTATDIDALKRAQAELKAETEQRRIAGRLARMGGWIADPVRELIIFSEEAASLVDLPAGAVDFDSVLGLLAPESAARAKRALAECVGQGIAFDLEVQLRTPRGRTVWVRSIGQAVRDEGGRVVRIEGAQQDITDRVQLLDEVRQLNAHLEERIAQRTSELARREGALRLANEQLQAFSYSVSHDLQSPLQRLVSFAQLLQAELGPAPAPRAMHYLQRIRANAGYMMQLIEGLLALAQVSQVQIIRGPVNLSEMATEILARRAAEEPERRVQWRVEPGLSVTGDVRLMRSVLENLLGNAWKFTARTADPRIEFCAGEAPGEFVVRDNGAGFDMAYADKLFGSFQRLHRDDEFPGTGIGLATVARAISRHGGRIRAEAAPGRGASFHFTLPQGPAGA